MVKRDNYILNTPILVQFSSVQFRLYNYTDRTQLYNKRNKSVHTM